VYLVKLNNLNQILLQENLADDVFALLSYEDNKPIWYLCCAAFLVLASAGMIYYEVQLWKGSDEYIIDFIIFIVMLVVIITIISWIWVLINNPILKAFIIVVIGGSAFGAKLS